MRRVPESAGMSIAFSVELVDRGGEFLIGLTLTGVGSESMSRKTVLHQLARSPRSRNSEVTFQT